jgi:hypothetical protein
MNYAISDNLPKSESDFFIEQIYFKFHFQIKNEEAKDFIIAFFNNRLKNCLQEDEEGSKFKVFLLQRTDYK